MKKYNWLVLMVPLSIASMSNMAMANVRMFIHHEVAEYAIWKKAYDNFAAQQKKAGVFYQAVYQATDNPNDVTVIHDFHHLKEAKAFLASAEVKATMEKIGVKGIPQIWITNKGKK